MFEIRIICDPTDTDRVSQALAAAFAAGAVRQYPTRDGERTRLYVTADHHPTPKPRPTANDVYATAPSILSEIWWTTDKAADPGYALGREYWLRKAAVLDRIALRDEADGAHGDAAEAATEAARHLMDLDDVHGECHPRAYTRWQYAHRASNQ